MSAASESFSAVLLRSVELGMIKKAVLSKPDDPTVKRAELRLADLRSGRVLQLETFTSDNKAYHRNLPLPVPAETVNKLISGYKQINLLTIAGECEYRRSKSGNDTAIGADKLMRALSRCGETSSVMGNDHEKTHILDGSEPFLKLLGVSGANGRIYDKKQSKFRQINKFLEHIRFVEKYLPNDRIRICDLCCGKSYLSFATYHYFANIRGMQVSMTGVDLKADVIEYCSQIAKELHFDGLDFVCGDIRKYVSEERPQLVISLHACDTATDIVLETAMAWGSEVILSTPCCHHELNHTLNCPTLSFIADYSMLRQKFCDAATDALRLKLLEANGYRCAALELIDPEETPKNIMLRAIRRPSFDPKGAEAERAMEEYTNAKRFLTGG